MAGVAILPRPSGAQTDVRLTVEKAGVVRVNLVLADFVTQYPGPQGAELGRVVRNILKNDFLNSGLFNLRELDATSPSEGRGLDSLLARLKSEGQDAMLAGSIIVLDGVPNLDTRLYDTTSGRVIDRGTYELRQEKI